MNPRDDISRSLPRWRQRLSTMRQALVWMGPSEGGAPSALVQAFDDWAAGHEGAIVEVWLPSHALLTWAGPGASEAQALRDQAIDRWAHYLDLPPGDFERDWLIQTSLDLGSTSVALACAVSRELVDGLQAVVQRRGMALRAIVPWWARPLRQDHLGLPAVSESEASRWWVGQEGPWQTQAHWAVESGDWVLRSLSFIAADEDVADEHGAGEQVSRCEAPVATQLVAENRRAPSRGRADWAEALNFAGPRMPVSFWSWALLALSVIAVLHAVDLDQQMAASEQATESEWARLQAHSRAGVGVAASHQAAALASRAAPAVPDAPPLQADGWRAAAQLAASLAHPWALALDFADASAHRRGVSLTRFQLDLASWGTRAGQPLPWRLQAAVPDDMTALAWVQELGPEAMLQRRDALPQPVPSARHTLSWRIDVAGVADQTGGQP